MRLIQIKTLTVSIFGALSLLMGAAVLFGWYTHDITFVQIHPNFVPMQANTAVCFLLSGLGLIALSLRNTKASIISGLSLFIIATLTLFQYVFQLDLNIDQAIIKHYITTKTSHPGRMAPNTAIIFILTAILLCLNSIKYHSKTLSFLKKLSTSTILLIGFVSLVGYLFSAESLYGWMSLTRMAFHTSVGVIFIGLGMFFHESGLKHQEKEQYIWWSSAFIILASFSISFGLWHEMNKQEQLLIRRTVIEEANYISHNLSLTVNSKFFSMQRMASRWEQASETTRSNWKSDALQHEKDDISLKAIVLVNQNLEKTWSTYSDQSNFNSILEDIIASNLTTTNTSDELQVISAKEQLLIVTTPLFIENNFQGYLIGLFNIKDILLTVIPPKSLSDMGLSIVFENNVVFKEYTPNTEYVRKWNVQTFFVTMGIEYSLTLTPSVTLINNLQSYLPEFVFTTGSIIGLMIAIIIALGRITSMKARDLTIIEKAQRITTKSLRVSQKKLKETVKKLSLSNSELEQFAYVASHDLKAPLRIIHSNAEILEMEILKTIKNDLTDNIKEPLRIITSRTKKMARLLENILEYSRIGKKHSSSQGLIMNGMTLMQETLELLSLSPNITVDIDSKFNNITLYEMPIKQIMINLINNSIKHNDSELIKIKISLSEDPNHYIFKVKDNGLGIPVKYNKQVFEMFRTLKPQDKVEGTGMGLAIVKKLVEVNKGQIKLESEIGKGSTFTFTLPKIKKGYRHQSSKASV
ncbi:MAG: ATP-binding protein [Chlamydiota bacterium]|nr:ATP-binding protein [Chlamydiota bacterium]